MAIYLLTDDDLKITTSLQCISSDHGLVIVSIQKKIIVLGFIIIVVVIIIVFIIIISIIS